tara:strand:+ start:2681 stop:3058 length:378 start_codon:yes stop_codon:yes gene_type:complete
MKFLLTIIILISFGCNHNSRVIEAIDYPMPPPPPNVLPYSSPPNFIPDITELAEIQINPLPHPFNLNGTIPYAVWVNGEKLALSGKEVRDLALSLNLKFEQPKDTAKIHNGEGWQYPFPSENLNK